MRILRVLSPKLAQFLLALAIIPGVAAGERVSTIRGAVATLGPGDMPVFLPGVQVVLRCEKLAKKTKTTVTDETGRFSFLDLSPGECGVTATAQGFRSETKTVAVAENSAVELSFQLDPKTVAERTSEARMKRGRVPANPGSARSGTKRNGWRP